MAPLRILSNNIFWCSVSSFFLLRFGSAFAGFARRRRGRAVAYLVPLLPKLSAPSHCRSIDVRRDPAPDQRSTERVREVIAILSRQRATRAGTPASIRLASAPLNSFVDPTCTPRNLDSFSTHCGSSPRVHSCGRVWKTPPSLNENSLPDTSTPEWWRPRLSELRIEFVRPPAGSKSVDVQRDLALVRSHVFAALRVLSGALADRGWLAGTGLKSMQRVVGRSFASTSHAFAGDKRTNSAPHGCAQRQLASGNTLAS